MLSIAICDDQQDSLETIEEELHRSSKNLNVFRHRYAKNIRS